MTQLACPGVEEERTAEWGDRGGRSEGITLGQEGEWVRRAAMKSGCKSKQG